MTHGLRSISATYLSRLIRPIRSNKDGAAMKMFEANASGKSTSISMAWLWKARGEREKAVKHSLRAMATSSFSRLLDLYDIWALGDIVKPGPDFDRVEERAKKFAEIMPIAACVRLFLTGRRESYKGNRDRAVMYYRLAEKAAAQRLVHVLVAPQTSHNISNTTATHSQ